MSERLQRYLAARDGGPTWVADYHRSIAPSFNVSLQSADAFIWRHYQGLLEDLITALGETRVRGLVAALANIDQVVAQITPEDTP